MDVFTNLTVVSLTSGNGRPWHLGPPPPLPALPLPWWELIKSTTSLQHLVLDGWDLGTASETIADSVGDVRTLAVTRCTRLEEIYQGGQHIRNLTVSGAETRHRETLPSTLAMFLQHESPALEEITVSAWGRRGLNLCSGVVIEEEDREALVEWLGRVAESRVSVCALAVDSSGCSSPGSR